MSQTTPTITTATALEPPTRSAPRQSARIGQLLLQRGLITAEQLAEAVQVQQARYRDRPLGEVLVELGRVTRRDVASTLAAAVGIPFAVLAPAMVRPEATACLTAEFCHKHNVLPLTSVDGWMTVAVEDFTNVFLAEEIKRLSGQQVQILAAEGDNIRRTRSQVSSQDGSPPPSVAGGEGGLPSLDQNELDELTFVTQKPQQDEDRDLEAEAAGSPIIRLVNHVIRAAVEARASDIHIEPEEKEIRIRYRIDGELTIEQFHPTIRFLSAVVSRIKIMAGMDISERRLPQDGGITVNLGNRPIELRVSTMATPMGEKVAMRITDNTAGVRKLGDLGFAPALLQDLRRAIRQPNGIVLVTGPTGCGKSTTLYSSLSEVVSPKVNICTVEDPVEYHLKGTNQFQVNAKAGFTFARALRSLLRQDPDIIMVGEIRDAETAKLATEAALTGHLVLSTLHTNDAPSAIPRLVNMGIEPYLVAASVRAVMAQRLVRRLCQHCRKQVPLTAAVKQMLVQSVGGESPLAFSYEGAGCARCRFTGFAGRTGVHELIIMDEEMLGALGRDLSLPNMRRLAESKGFTSLFRDCLAKVREGITPVESLFDVAGQADLSDLEAVPAAA
jgi:type IV pilus assembly protein PilB